MIPCDEEDISGIKPPQNQNVTAALDHRFFFKQNLSGRLKDIQK